MESKQVDEKTKAALYQHLTKMIPPEELRKRYAFYAHGAVAELERQLASCKTPSRAAKLEGRLAKARLTVRALEQESKAPQVESTPKPAT